MKLREVMSQNVKSIGPQTTIKDAAKLMASAEVGILPIVEPSGKVLGVVTDRDLAVRCLARAISPERPVKEVMTQNVFAMDEDNDFEAALNLMREKKVGRVVVHDKKGYLAGVLSFSDALLLCNTDPQALMVSEALSSRVPAAARLAGRSRAKLI